MKIIHYILYILYAILDYTIIYYSYIYIYYFCSIYYIYVICIYYRIYSQHSYNAGLKSTGT